MKVAIIGPNLADQSKGQYHVHDADCRDIGKIRMLGRARVAQEDIWEIEADSKEEVAEAVYEDIMNENEGELAKASAYVSEFHFAPCTKGLK